MWEYIRLTYLSKGVSRTASAADSSIPAIEPVRIPRCLKCASMYR